MKKYILIIILFIACTGVYAQNSYLSIGLGTTIPKNDFASKESLLNSGYALSGFAIELDGTFFPTYVIGVSGLLGFGSIYSDQDAFYSNLGDYIADRPDLPGFVLPEQNQVDFTKGYWNYVNIMVGPELSAPIWRFQLGVKAMGGFSLVVVPKREVFYEDGLDMLEVSTKGTDLSFAYLYGGSIMYNMRSGTALRVSADYLSTKADYKFKFNADTPLGNVDEVSDASLNIDALQILVGLCYTF